MPVIYQMSPSFADTFYLYIFFVKRLLQFRLKVFDLFGQVKFCYRETSDDVGQPRCVVRMIMRKNDPSQLPDAHSAKGRADQLLSGVD